MKVSDIRSTSTDSVHLIFKGWEYYNGTEWVSLITVDNEGYEISDPNEDGVYLDLPVSVLETAGNIDLYPIFVEARWIAFVAGKSGSGASYVPSQYLESWGRAREYDPDDESGDSPGTNVFEELSASTRPGYAFDGWYAFAATDPATGNITNLSEPADVEVSYLVDNANSWEVHRITVNTTAVRVANGNPQDGKVTIAEAGLWSVVDDGDGRGHLCTDGSGHKLFKASGGKLRLFDPVDRLTLHAHWAPFGTRVTLVYWTENVQDKDYVYSPVVMETYSANKAAVYTTEELNTLYREKHGTDRPEPYTSGSELRFEDLADLGLFGNAKLAGAVPAGDEIFYDLMDPGTVIGYEKDENDNDREVHPDSSKIISGDGNTVFNVYYDRKTFKLVFHIGRDGYVKNGGHQKTDHLWDGNWIEFMYKDPKVTALGYPPRGSTGRNPQPSYVGVDGEFSMSYDGRTYDSSYVTNEFNVKGDYIPVTDPADPEYANDSNLYVLEAKYGAYIGDRWPTPGNTAFSFVDQKAASDGRYKTLYIWAAYYGSLYCRIANERSTESNPNGANPDINGVYSYMSRELCANREGTGLINSSQVHHLVAWFGEANKSTRFKKYHVLFEAIDGTYDPDAVTVVPGSDYAPYELTTWSAEHTVGDKSEIIGHSFFEPNEAQDVLSNLEPQFQLGETLDGYDLVYSCYDPVQRTNPDHAGQKDYHIYFFFRPKQYTLTFMFESGAVSDTYYYKESLEGKDLYDPPEKTGHVFMGWYPNEEGVGQRYIFHTEGGLTANTMPNHNVVLYPRLGILQYMVRIDPNGGTLDHRVTPDKSTYFTADFGTQIGEYEVQRTYVPLTDKELTSYTGERYYYLNMQHRGEPQEGDWGYPTDLRNAIFLTEAELHDYYENVYKAMVDPDSPTHVDFSWWSGIQLLPEDEFNQKYTSYPNHPYRQVSGGEHYSFMGWYQVMDDGGTPGDPSDDQVSTMPFNFSDPVNDTLTLRAMWRLDGGYYIKYNAAYYVMDGEGHVSQIVYGDMDDWNDPADPGRELYADQAFTHVLRSPKHVTDGYVFRGWRVVREDGVVPYIDEGVPKTYINWKPIQLDAGGNPVYYQPGDPFTIDSELVSDVSGTAKIIHMQAFYETEDETHRRPDVTNLTLDANKAFLGYVNTTDSGSLPAFAGPGKVFISDDAATFDTENNPTEILFGDIQSNAAIHLNRYAPFFEHHNAYLLIGYDANTDPENPSTGHGFAPAFARDAVIAVQRSDNETLYAMWEPMVYITFKNDTDANISVTLNADDPGAHAMEIVNTANAFERAPVEGSVTVPARASVRVVMPHGAGESVTATAVNDHAGKVMSVSGTYPDETPYGTGHTGVPYGYPVNYTGTLVNNDKGILVTYTEENDPGPRVFFDVNNGVWTPQSEDYVEVTGTGLYSILKSIIAEHHNVYEPVEPTRSGKVFLGWTRNADVAGMTDFSSETMIVAGTTTLTPDPGGNILELVKRDYLWDFTQVPPDNLTLLAVWSDTATVTFDLVYTGENLHNWEGPALSDTDEPYVYYRNSADPGYITYTLAKGDRVPKPSDPTVNTAKTWSFLKWLSWNSTVDSYRRSTKKINDANLINYTYDFSSHVTEDRRLSTSWTDQHPQTFTFTVENHVSGDPNAEFTYTIAIENDKRNKSGNVRDPNPRWGSVTTQLKNNETYTVRVTVMQISNWGGAWGVGIDVIDRNGVTVKSGQVLTYPAGASGGELNKDFTTDYKYTLKITQASVPNYETDVAVSDVTGDIVYETDAAERLFSFTSIKKNTTGSAAMDAAFDGGPLNAYVDGAHNSLRIVFTNIGETVVAPTGTSFAAMPFILMMMFGFLFGAAFCFLRRGKRAGFMG